MIKRDRIRFAALLLNMFLLFTAVSPAYAVWGDDAFQQAENLVRNSGFENGEDGWDFAESNAEISTSSVYTGEHGLQFNQGGTLRQDITIPEPGQYEFKMNYITEFIDMVLINIKYISENSTIDFYDYLHSEEEVWQKTGYSLYLTSNGTLEITIAVINSIDLAIDDVCLSPLESLKEPLPGAENLIPNPDFENGITGWSPAASLTWENDSYTGRHSLGVLNKAEALCSFPSLEDGTYEITAFVKSTRSAVVTMSLNVWFLSLSVPIEAETWTKLSFITTLRENDIRELNIKSDSNQLSIDDVSVVPTHYDGSSQNLLQNPSFEETLNGWQQHGEPNSLTTDSVFYDKSYSAFFSSFYNRPFDHYISQDIAVNGGGTYTYYAFMKPDQSLSGSGGMLELEARDAGGNILKRASSNCISYPARGWQRANLIFDAPAGTVTLTAKIGSLNCTGAFYVDFVNLEQIK